MPSFVETMFYTLAHKNVEINHNTVMNEDSNKN